MIGDYFKLSIKTFRARKLRSWLTMIGIFIGIAAVVSLVSLGQGLQKAIGDLFNQMGTDKIMVTAGSAFMGLSVGGIELKEGDLNVIKKVSGVDLAGGYIYKFAQMKFKDQTKYTYVIGYPLDESRRLIAEVAYFKISEGRELKQGDKYKADVGISLSEGKLFSKKVSVGDNIEIEGRNFNVVGGMERIGNPQDDAQVYIPMETAREILNVPEKYDMLMAKVSDAGAVQQVADRIKKRLREYRNVKEGEEDFSVETINDLRDTYGTVMAIIQAVVIGIAAISLFVGGVGIMNTMFTSVLERTSQIGVMKAVGAANHDILMIFLVESGVLGLLGGAVGIIFGMLISKFVSYITVLAGITYIESYFPWYLIVGALAFSFIIGMISGAVPAYRAMKMKPVDALRYE